MRSESDKLCMAPLKVTLGVKVYEIELLRTMKAREWRGKLIAELGEVLQNFSITTSDSKIASAGLIASLRHFPDKICDLLFAYGTDLPKEEIMEQATEEQIGMAFSEVLEVAFPFLGQLGLVTQILKSELSPSPKPASSTLQ